MQSLVIPLLADIPTVFSVTKSDSAWILTATLLSAAVFTPLSGRLADLYGKKRVLVPTLLIVTVGCLISALSTSLAMLIVGRTLQGAMIATVPLGISVLRDVLPPERLTHGVALVSSSLGVGGALGFPLCAVIYDVLGWHALFWTGAGLSVAVLLTVLLLVPADQRPTGGRFDLVGALLLAVGLVLVLLAISKAPDWGLLSPWTIGSAVVGLAVLAVWVRIELRLASPLVDLRLATLRPVLLTNLAACCLGFSVYGFQLATPIVVQLDPASGAGLGLPVTIAGLCLMPAGLMMLSFSPVGARISTRFSPQLTLIVGSLIIATAYFAATQLMDTVWQLAAVSLMLGVGFGFTFGSIPSLIMRASPHRQTGEANGLNSLVRSLGSSLGSTVYAVILATFVAVHDDVVTPTRLGLQLTYAAAGAVMIVAAVLAFQITRRTAADRGGR